VEFVRLKLCILVWAAVMGSCYCVFWFGLQLWVVATVYFGLGCCFG